MVLATYPDWLMWSAELTAEECDEIISLCRELPLKEASTFGNSGDEIRKTNIRWVPNDEKYGGIHSIVREFSEKANEYFGLELSHLPPLQFTEYADVGHHYDFHHDIDWARQDGSHRKLSIVIQLTEPEEYEGGEFSFRYIQNPDPNQIKQRGTILCFIPYHEHAVSAITKGSRISLVGWFEGPRWR